MALTNNIQILKRGEEIYRQASDAQRRDFSLDEIKHVEFLASSILHEVRGMIASDNQGLSTSNSSTSSVSSSTPSSASTSATPTTAEIPSNTEMTEDGVLKVTFFSFFYHHNYLISPHPSFPSFFSSRYI